MSGGSTSLTIDCDQSSGAAFAVEASLLATIGTIGVLQSNEVDIPAAAIFANSTTDTGCPSGTSCTVATFVIPATFSAADSNALCAPSTAQINAGLYGCAIAVANAQQAPVAGAAYLMTYASQAAPAAPSVAALQSTGSANSLINLSDAPGAAGHWWGNALASIQATLAGTTPGVAPSTCASGGGNGNVPTSYLHAVWIAASGVATTATASNVTISNNCYDGKTLVAPVLGGTLSVPATAAAGAYSVYLCELNVTPEASNDASTTPPCGTPPKGTSWVDASFSFTVAAGIVTQNLPDAGAVGAAASVGFTDQLVTSGNTGTVTYTQSTGAPSLAVSSSGAVTTSGALAAGTYSATGTTSDASGDTGTFTYTLSVAAAPAKAPVIKKVAGLCLPGKPSTITVSGSNFTLHPSVSAPAGTKITVKKSLKSALILIVTAPTKAKKGTYSMKIHFAGKTLVAKYHVK
ncbi:MAG TPA: hypothetical protein VNE22_01950 [Acidimicrobiales bacterium]|nr:hypothetical protein [Acidimicrobiales bacterium]